MKNVKRLLFRIVIPVFPNFNIYTSLASHTTSVGPVCVATNADKLDRWDVEVIDENNCHGRFCPRDRNNLPDHEQLQRDRPADVVGFYASISSTIPRIYELAEYYKSLGVRTVAGGKHVEALFKEALEHDIDAVVLGEGEITIKELLSAWENNQDLSGIKGIAFLNNGSVFKTENRPLIHDFDKMPLPDFSLMRYARIKIYPIARTRGCNSNCEFCAVKDKARCGSPENLMKQVRYLVETRGARQFFEASDHFGANREEAIKFCNMLADYQNKYRLRLRMTVQTRITDAKYPELLEAMKKANIHNVCIGYESPIDEELIAMRKGYKSEDLIRWTNVFHKYGFFIHGMFIFGYPQVSDRSHRPIPLRERAKYFRDFIRKSRVDTLQVLLTIPLPGTELRERLIKENRIFSIDQLGWEYYDGQYPLFMPDDGVEPEELQHIVGDLMRRYYNLSNLWKVSKNILIHFPAIVFTSAFTIVIGKVKYINLAFNLWYRKYFRNYALRFSGYFIVKNWFKQFREGAFPEKLHIAKVELAEKNMISTDAKKSNFASKVDSVDSKSSESVDCKESKRE
jgi:radical SAM superfamily enzyme YgiQ (UPF0313 family)